MLSKKIAAVFVRSAFRRSIPVGLRLFTSKSIPKDDSIVSVEWLSQRIDQEDLKIVDCSPFEHYFRAHIPTSTHLCLPPNLKDPDLSSNSVIAENVFENALARVGIDRDTKIVAYDTTSGTLATRFWWVARYYGLSNISILQGGWMNWVNKKKTAECGPPPDCNPTVPRLNKNEDLITSKETLQDIVAAHQKNDIAIVDARTPEEYRGSQNLNRRAGHVPSSVNLSNTLFCDPHTGKYLSKEETANLLQKHGFPAPEEVGTVVTYCQAGLRATQVAFMLDRLGYNTSVYERSMAEWANVDDTKMSIGGSG